MRLSLAALGLALLTSLPAAFAAGLQAADVEPLLAGPRQAAQHADYRIAGKLARVDAGGTRTSYDVSIKAHWFSGELKILVEVTAPAEARANILMEMRPSGQNTMRIAHPGDKSATTIPFDKWMDGPLGAGFSYEDLLEQHYFWPNQAALDPEKRGARDCDVLKSTPGPSDKTHYSEVRTWLDHTIDFPIYVEKTTKTSGTVKEFSYYGLRHDGGVWSATQIEEKTRGQAGSSFLIINRGSAKANLTLGDFSPERIIHF
jgi:Outer membrane lipoprotein-sorting protein